MSDSFLYTSVLDPLAQPLLDELLFEYDSRYGTFFNAEGAKAELSKYPPEAFSPPYGNFLLLLRDGKAIGGGAFMRHDDETAEFKRVWTHSAIDVRDWRKRCWSSLNVRPFGRDMPGFI